MGDISQYEQERNGARVWVHATGAGYETRELAPTLTAVIVGGRIGAGMAAGLKLDPMLQAAEDGFPLLVESTVNQVNQFGGYTGMTARTALLRGSAVPRERKMVFPLTCRLYWAHKNCTPITIPTIRAATRTGVLIVVLFLLVNQVI